jgi:hypothetical protein
LSLPALASVGTEPEFAERFDKPNSISKSQRGCFSEAKTLNSKPRPPNQPDLGGESDRLKLFEAEFDRIRLGGTFDKGKLLELFAFDVDGQGKSKLVKMLEMISRLRSLQMAPGGLAFLRLQSALVSGRIQSQYRAHVSNLTGALFVIIGRASEGDERAQQQLEALNRIAFAAEYDLGDEMIEGVADRQPKAVNDLRRGRALLAMMNRISVVVRPKASEQFLSPDTKIIRAAKIEPFDLQVCGSELCAQVNAHEWNAKTTLRSLAVSIYLNQLAQQDPNSKVDEKMLRRGLALETKRQDKPHPGPSWILGISRSPFEWLPFSLSLLPLGGQAPRNKKAVNKHPPIK